MLTTVTREVLEEVHATSIHKYKYNVSELKVKEI